MGTLKPVIGTLKPVIGVLNPVIGTLFMSVTFNKQECFNYSIHIVEWDCNTFRH